MEENKHFLHVMLYYSKKSKNATEMQNKTCAVYGEGVVTELMFKSGLRGFVLDDAPQSGKAVEVDSNQTETLIENNRCYTTWERAHLLKIYELMKLLVEMKNMSFILWKKCTTLSGQPNISIVNNGWRCFSLSLLTI